MGVAAGTDATYFLPGVAALAVALRQVGDDLRAQLGLLDDIRTAATRIGSYCFLFVLLPLAGRMHPPFVLVGAGLSVRLSTRTRFRGTGEWRSPAAPRALQAAPHHNPSRHHPRCDLHYVPAA